MSTQSRVMDYHELLDKDLKDYIGVVCYGPTKEEYEANEALPLKQQKELWYFYFHCEEERLSDYYKQHNSHRRPILLVVEPGLLFCVDSKAWDGIKRDGGWIVSGEIDQLTVVPSIWIKGYYHGFLTDGIVSDNLEK